MAKVYVGNLSWNTTDDGLAQAFSPFGQLTDYIVMKDRDTGCLLYTSDAADE